MTTRRRIYCQIDVRDDKFRGGRVQKVVAALSLCRAVASWWSG